VGGEGGGTRTLNNAGWGSEIKNLLPVQKEKRRNEVGGGAILRDFIEGEGQ